MSVSIKQLCPTCTETTISTTKTELPTTTPCAEYKKSSKEVGTKTTATPEFTLSLLNVSSIIIYSGNNLYALEFVQQDSTKITFGNVNNPSITNIDNLNLSNFGLIGITISYTDIIESIQFVSKNLITSEIETSVIYGTLSQQQLTLNQETFAPQGSDFLITRITGSSNDNSITSLSFEYVFRYCGELTSTTSPALTTRSSSVSRCLNRLRKSSISRSSNKRSRRCRCSTKSMSNRNSNQSSIARNGCRK